MSWLISRALMEDYANSHSLPGLVAEYSEATCSAGVPSAQLNVMPTQHPFWRNDKMMDASSLSRFGLKCAVLTDDLGAALLTWFLADSRVRTYPLPGLEPELTVIGQDCGVKWHESSVRFDPVSCSWKTAHCLWEEDLPWCSVTLPKWGSMRNGHVFQHPTLVRPINVIASGLWPTTTVHGNYNKPGASKTSGTGLATAVKLWPTPQASDNRDRGNLSTPSVRRRVEEGKQVMLSMCVSSKNGLLNPDWTEWLMGWPIGWTGLKPLAMDRCHCAQPLHGDCLQTFDCWKRHFSQKSNRESA